MAIRSTLHIIGLHVHCEYFKSCVFWRDRMCDSHEQVFSTQQTILVMWVRSLTCMRFTIIYDVPQFLARYSKPNRK